jgi:uncharacterized protein with HEPN domain
MFIFDIYIAILKIKKVVSKFDNAQDLLYDFTKWDSVIREFEIIGEASKYLSKTELLDKEYRRVVDFRNIITHEYFGIDAQEVWNIIFSEKINDFEKTIVELIKNIEPNLKNELIDSFIKDNHYLDFIVEKLKSLY